MTFERSTHSTDDILYIQSAGNGALTIQEHSCSRYAYVNLNGPNNSAEFICGVAFLPKCGE